MIKDIADSKRIDSHVHKDKDFPSDVCYVRLFSPFPLIYLVISILT